MLYENWKIEAERLFFIEKCNIEQISQKIKISRKSISKYLNSLPNYNTESESRKEENKLKRKEYQREWDKTNRPNRYGNMAISKESLKREHKIAVRVLSADRF